jgi:hypothetical protein
LADKDNPRLDVSAQQSFWQIYREYSLQQSARAHHPGNGTMKTDKAGCSRRESMLPGDKGRSAALAAEIKARLCARRDGPVAEPRCLQSMVSTTRNGGGRAMVAAKVSPL